MSGTTYTAAELADIRRRRHADRSDALTEDQVAQEWVDEGGDPQWATPMAKLAIRESAGKVKTNNRGLNKNGTVDWGLYQVNDVWRSDPVVGPLFKSGAILTAKGATTAAIRIFEVQGPKAWATYNEATDKKYLGAFTGSKTPQDDVTTPTVAPRQSATTGVDEDSAMTDALLDHKRGGSLLKRYMGRVDSGNYATEAPATTAKVPVSPDHSATVSSDGSVDALKAAAQTINDEHSPYKWGGGHGDDSGLYDCSGVVSKLLGVNPRVASQFETFGSAGHGKRVTIYAKDSHVLMEIDGHFYGTSASNPGGGPGWIPRAKISPSYLAGFTVRHPTGQ